MYFNVLVSVKPPGKLIWNVIAFLSSFCYKINEYPKSCLDGRKESGCGSGGTTPLTLKLGIERR
jgi:hypothetical protein